MVFYPAIFTKENDGDYSVSFPDLDGCFSCGDGMSRAAEMATEALDGYLASVMDRGLAVPKPSDIKDVKTANGEYVVMISGNPEKLLKKNKAVKKTLTIPEWLNDEADKRHINYSSVLQDALKQAIGV